ncbi:MFS transporter [Arthrobacter yangruifuii]|uniref:MFS transporter n=1 Tax=Arthrobacter yangruifuii TaxID=2606616 RepID=UPI0011B3CC73|nr:MFS transporter [Arthrobacter yangruifuii]
MTNLDAKNSAVETDQTARKQSRRSLRASTIGQLLEWYEWSSYAVFAPFIAAAMFNQSDPASALLSTLAVFAVGFLMRPLGGVVFGAISDRKGRKKVMITTMIMMALASVAIGLMPSYDTIGLGASIGLLLVRMIQGFAHGGESATANSYIPEIAPRQKRGQWGSLVFVAIFGGSVIAYVLGGIISLVLAESQVAEWGWRIPFFLGAFGAVFALYLRRGMHESEVFDAKSNETIESPVPVSAPVLENAAGPGAGARKPRPRWVSILLIIGMVSGVTAAHYTWSSYVSTYAITQQGMSIQGAYWVTVVAQIVALGTLPLWGMLSDRIGRKPVIYFFAIAMGVFQIPLMAMITDEPWTLLVASTVALVIVAASGSLLSSIMSEVFPTSQRTQSIGLAYSVSVAGFGGTAPYVYQLFVSMDLAWLSGALVVILCILTFVAMKLLPETKGVDLRTV